MTFAIVRVIQAAIAVGALETLINSYPFHSFYALPTAMYAVLETLLYLLIICIEAFIATRISPSAGWAQKLVFFLLVGTPAFASSYMVYRNVSFYWQGGRALIVNHRVTTAGVEHLLTNLAIAVLLALVAALIYFRGSEQPD